MSLEYTPNKGSVVYSSQLSDPNKPTQGEEYNPKKGKSKNSNNKTVYNNPYSLPETMNIMYHDQYLKILNDPDIINKTHQDNFYIGYNFRILSLNVTGPPNINNTSTKVEYVFFHYPVYDDKYKKEINIGVATELVYNGRSYYNEYFRAVINDNPYEPYNSKRDFAINPDAFIKKVRHLVTAEDVSSGVYNQSFAQNALDETKKLIDDAEKLAEEGVHLIGDVAGDVVKAAGHVIGDVFGAILDNPILLAAVVVGGGTALYFGYRYTQKDKITISE